MSRVTHEEKVLALLSDEKPHSHHEIYALYVIGHSRISGLKGKGFGIEHWQEGQTHWYQLVSRPLAESGQADPSSPGVGLVPTSPVPDSASGSGLGVLPDNDRVDTNVQSPAPLDNLCSESTGAQPGSVEPSVAVPGSSTDESHLSVLPGGQLTLRWAA